MHSYRNVVVEDDGSITGERTLGADDRLDSEPRYMRFSASPKLLRIREALDRYPHLDEEIWELQDGYGFPGFTPVQGWDWSGIRDSSPAAIDEMFALASEYVSDSDMDQILGL